MCVITNVEAMGDEMVKQRLTGVSVEPINEDMSIDLPIGVSTFRDIIKGDYLYIDKTQYIYRLVHKTKGSYFLSRPRRFGKSLFVSTLDELFQGNRDLFQGLWIGRSDYDWETHPVIRIDLSRHPIHDQASLEKSFQRHLQRIASRYGIDLSEDSPAVMFEDLIYELSMEKQVVVLIDEYDKPLIDHLDNLNEAKQIRRTLKEFYGVVKSMEAHIRLVFITGISKFSKVSIFSELNHLTDLTMNTAFGTALGLTETENSREFGGSDHSFRSKGRHFGRSSLRADERMV